jgi:hypothetical protein
MVGLIADSFICVKMVALFSYEQVGGEMFPAGVYCVGGFSVNGVLRCPLARASKTTQVVPFKSHPEIGIDVHGFQVPEEVPQACWSMRSYAKYFLHISTIFYFQQACTNAFLLEIIIIILATKGKSRGSMATPYT